MELCDPLLCDGLCCQLCWRAKGQSLSELSDCVCQNGYAWLGLELAASR